MKNSIWTESNGKPSFLRVMATPVIITGVLGFVSGIVLAFLNNQFTVAVITASSTLVVSGFGFKWGQKAVEAKPETTEEGK